MIAIFYVPLGSRHGAKKNRKTPALRNTRRTGHPENLNRFLSVYVLEWYHSIVRAR